MLVARSMSGLSHEQLNSSREGAFNSADSADMNELMGVNGLPSTSTQLLAYHKDR